MFLAAKLDIFVLMSLPLLSSVTNLQNTNIIKESACDRLKKGMIKGSFAVAIMSLEAELQHNVILNADCSPVRRR